MSMSNPFFYGNPVPYNRFFGRRRELRRLVDRIVQGQSSAIVGEPHSGKTSLLNYLAASEMRAELYGEFGEKLLFSYLDAHTLDSEFSQVQFWEYILRPLHEQTGPDSQLAWTYQSCRENNFGAFVLERLFAEVDQLNWRLVLMLDEFDVLLHHPILNSAEFFGSLRSLASRSQALALIVASRLPVTSLNTASQQLNRTSTPYFNILSEVILRPLSNRDSANLLAQAGDRFVADDRHFIVQISGGNVYLLQVAAFGMWDAYGEGLDDSHQRWQRVGQYLYDEATMMLSDIWRLWSPVTRKAFTIVALAHMSSLSSQHKPIIEHLVNGIRDFGPELRLLQQQGFVTTDDTVSGGWRVRPQVFLWWFVDELTRVIASDIPFEEWLQVESLEDMLTKREKQQLGEATRAILNSPKGGVADLIAIAAKGTVERSKSYTGRPDPDSGEMETWERALVMAHRTLATLEEQAAGYTVLSIPASLVNEIETKRQEIARLQSLLAGKEGGTEALPNTLPHRVSFFGREEEIAYALDTLSPEDRSWGLMINGIGGIGKTALAVEVAYLCLEQARFDVFLFTTAKLTTLAINGERSAEHAAITLDAMLSEVSWALGEQDVAQQTGTDQRRGLLDGLRRLSSPDRRVLLVLDSLETLPVEEQTALFEFLDRLPPYCKAIVTSRRRAGKGAASLRLERLEREAARQLIVDEMHRDSNLERILTQTGEARWQELYDATGGSPLALHWTLELMRVRNLSLDQALELLCDSAAGESPLYQFIFREARREMSDDDWRVLGALSLFAAPVSHDILLDVTGLPSTVLVSTLERLDAYALVDVAGPDDLLSLHPLTHQLVVDGLTAEAQRLLLRRALQAGQDVDYWLDHVIDPVQWVAMLKEYAGSARVMDRRLAAAGLGQVVAANPETVQAIETLAELMIDEDGEVRADAAESLKQLVAAGSVSGKLATPRAVEPLLQTLEQYAAPSGVRRLLPGRQRQEDAEMREAIAKMLGAIGDPRAVESLVTQLRDPSPSARLAAAQALGDIGDDHAIRALRRALGDSNAAVSQAAKAALGQITYRESTSEETAAYDEGVLEQPGPTIGIIIALSKEYAAVKVMLENQREYTVPGRGAGRRYLLGEIPAAGGGKHSLVLSLAHMGEHIAATTTSLLLEHFPTVNVVIMVGIAGGIPYPERPDEHVRLGDIVVSDQRGIIQYDFYKEEIIETIHPHSHRLPNTALLEGVRFLREMGSEGSNTWQALIDQATDKLGITRPLQETDTLASSTFPMRVIPHPEDPKRVEGRPRIHIGPIASANKLLEDPVKRDELRDRFSVKAVEMEGSGVVDATWHHEVGYLVVRGICDYCRHSKGDDWQQYAAIVAAAFTRALLESIHPEQLHSDYMPVYSWYISVDISAVDLTVGAPITFTLRLTPDEQPGSKALRIPVSALELTVYVEAPGFYLEGEHIRTLPVIDGIPVARRLSFELIPLISGEQKVRLLVYPGQRVEGLQPAKLTQVVHVMPPVALPDIPELIDRRAIPGPQPNVMLYVALEETPDGQQVRLNLTCPALDLDREPLDPLPLTEQDLAGLRQAAVQAAAEMANTSSPDTLASLRAFGWSLFDRLMPPGHPLREWYWRTFPLTAFSETPWSWLIVSDERATLPWELVCPYMPRPDRAELWHDEFLGRKFVLAHWVGRQGLTLAGEAPLGLLDLTHYQQRPQEIPRWQAILGGADQVGVEDETRHLALMQDDSRYYGLHILRYSDRHQLGRITALDGQKAKPAKGHSEAETMIVDRRLDFTLRRPVVGLSFVDEQPVSVDMGLWGRDTRLEAGWMLPLMHAGATALVGTRWPVSPEADQLFFRIFYQTIRNGVPLGWAVWEAREQVRLVFPHRPDWLAYAYFGHPWCQPYRVRPAQGFTLFEAIDHPEDEPFLVGEMYRFRASYRGEPPIWYDGHLQVQMEPLQAEPPMVMIIPMTATEPTNYSLERVPQSDEYQRIVNLTMPDEEMIWTVLIRFQNEDEELATMALNLDVVEGR